MGANESRTGSTSDKNRPSASPAATGTVTANTAEKETRHAVTEKESERLYLGFNYLSLEERGKDAIVVKENREEGGRGDDQGRCNLEKDVEVVVRDYVTNNKYGEERREEAVSEKGSKEGGEKEKEAAWEEELNEGKEVKGGEEESGWLGEEEELEMPCYTQRSNAIDCTFYLKTGTCAYNNNCKFNHPPDRRNNKIVPENAKRSRRKKKVTESTEVQNCEMALENANDDNIVQEVPGTVEGPEYKTVLENANVDKTEEGDAGKDEGSVRKTVLENANGDKTEEGDAGKDEGSAHKIVPENAKRRRRKKKVPESTEVQNCEMTLENANDDNIVQEIPVNAEGPEYKNVSKNATKGVGMNKFPKSAEQQKCKNVLENATKGMRKNKFLKSAEQQKCKNVSENAAKGIRKKKVPESAEQQKCKNVSENAGKGIRKKKVLESAEQQKCKNVSENAGKGIRKKKVPESAEQQKCKYYRSPNDCPSGSSCKFRHKPVRCGSESVELNFMGLPIRHGEKECPIYMHTGFCEFSINCGYHHPEPTEVGGSDSFSDALPPYVSHVPTTQNLQPHLEGNDYEYSLHGTCKFVDLNSLD